MTEIWIDAQLSPALAAWINRNYKEIEAQSVRAVGLRDAGDEEIYRAARKAEVTVMTKSNRRMRQILKQTLRPAVDMLEGAEAIVEIGDQ